MARRVVLWDLDGTVWDSAAWYDELCGPGAGTAVARLTAAGYTQARLRRVCEHQPPPLFEGVVDALDQLAEQGHRLGVVTSLSSRVALPLLEGCGLSERFEVVVPFTNSMRRKPAQIKHALTRLGVEPSSEHWYVGDTEGDRTSAAATGVSFAWAGWNVNPSEIDEPVPKHPSDLVNLIG